MALKTAVVILNFNGIHWLKKFLSTVVERSPEADVIVADNGSSDGSVDFLQTQFPNVRLILFDRNYGFAEGYNKALVEIDAEYCVLLNSDVEVTENWLPPLITYMNLHPETVACQPKILSYNEPEKFEYAGAAGGFIDAYGYPFCRGRILETLENDDGQYDEPMEIFWATGACFFIRRQQYFEVGGLDADFFAHQEEIDMCWRLKARGYSIVCLPQSHVFHVGGGTLHAESPRKTYLNFRNNALMVYKNMFGWQYVKVSTARFFLDIFAALNLFMQGKSKNALMVCKAKHDFRRMKVKYKIKRTQNNSETTVESCHEQYNGLILWNFHVLKQTRFSQILYFKKTKK